MNVHSFAADSGGRPQDVVFSEEEIHPIPNWTSLHVEGYYLPPLWRRFTQLTPQGDYRLQLAHPTGAILTLKVIHAPSDCTIPGLIGLECYTNYGEHGVVGDDAGLIISGSTGNLRREAQIVKYEFLHCRAFAGDVCSASPTAPKGPCASSAAL